MKSWHLWVGLALFVLVLLSIREGFVATATITNPNTWNAAEITRIKGLVTSKASYGSDIKTAVNALTDAEIRQVVGGFWSYSVPSALPNEPATAKGWSVAETQITSSDVTEYMNGIVRATPGYASKRAAFSALLTEYYITQGQSTFQTARAARWGGSATEDTTPPTPPADTAAAPTSIERPTTATQKLRQEIATTFGIPLSDTAGIDAIVTKVQTFYDTKYLPAKTTPTYTDIMGFADGIDTQTLPASVKNNFKVHIVEVIQTYFTPQTGVAETSSSSASRAAGAAAGSDAAPGDQGGWAGTGKNVKGPASGGTGSALENSTGGLGIPRNYPVLYGGMQDYESALPTSASLGSDPTAKFLPFSRVPGDQDLYPDPYRLGKYFSTSSYANKDAPEPAPFLADFSKFFT